MVPIECLNFAPRFVNIICFCFRYSFLQQGMYRFQQLSDWENIKIDLVVTVLVDIYKNTVSVKLKLYFIRLYS